MLNTALYTTFLASVVFLLLTPGPVIALITSTAARHGRFKALKTALGTNFASLVLIAIAILAISGFLSINKFFIYVIGVIGSLYIAYTSLTHLTNVFRKAYADTPYTSRSGFKYGFTIAISNPKDIFFFISFFPQFVGITDSTSLSLVILCISWIVLDLSILSTYIYIVHKISSTRTSKTLDIISTSFLLLISIVAFIYNIRMFYSLLHP
ncbi:TPA: LysE family transporter [Escherichia coli]|nr:LysE family transporter [Escherichia coli]